MPNNLKGYDGFQVLRSVFDVDKNCLRVCVVDGTTGGGPGFEVIIDHTNDSIRLGDGTSFFTSTAISSKVGLDVAVINEVDIQDLDASKDNVAINDSDGDELAINADGSININVVPSATATTAKNTYNEVTSVPTNTETTIATYTTIAGPASFLQKVSVSGENIAEYRVKVGGTIIDKKRTYFSGPLNAEFDFTEILNNGYFIASGTAITVTVIHQRSAVADFNARIQVLEI